MTDLFSSGRIVDAILALVALEAVLLLRRRALLLGLLPGVLLLLALRAALRGAGWPVIALCLAGAFAAHLADLGLRIARS
jgi:hypothetical protein